jgi:hypothetical protein
MMLDYNSDGVITEQELMDAIKETYDARECSASGPGATNESAGHMCGLVLDHLCRLTSQGKAHHDHNSACLQHLLASLALYFPMQAWLPRLAQASR